MYSYQGNIIPIEVKSSRSAKSRSLSLITEEIKKIKKTVKFSPDTYRVKNHHGILQIECPIYLVERINSLLE